MRHMVILRARLLMLFILRAREKKRWLKGNWCAEIELVVGCSTTLSTDKVGLVDKFLVLIFYSPSLNYAAKVFVVIFMGFGEKRHLYQDKT